MNTKYNGINEHNGQLFTYFTHFCKRIHQVF